MAGCTRTADRAANPGVTTTVTMDLTTGVAAGDDRPEVPAPAEPAESRFDAPAAASNDDQARAVIAQAVAILRELGGLIRAHRGDCDAMATALREFAARHDERLRAHRRRAMAIPTYRRAALMREQLGPTADLDAAVSVLESCRSHADVNAALERLQMF
jgi:hypothetical protein